MAMQGDTKKSMAFIAMQIVPAGSVLGIHCGEGLLASAMNDQVPKNTHAQKIAPNIRLRLTWNRGLTPWPLSRLVL
jgi:hypothetical protein